MSSKLQFFEIKSMSSQQTKLFTCSLPFHQSRSLENQSPTHAACGSSQIVLPLHTSHMHEDGCQSLAEKISRKSRATEAKASASAALDVGSLNPPRLRTSKLKNRSSRDADRNHCMVQKQQSTCNMFLIPYISYCLIDVLSQAFVKVSPLLRYLFA